MSGLRGRRRLNLIAAFMSVVVLALSFAAAAGARASQARPFASLPHLGPAPQRCFQYGSSDNICTGPSWPYPPNLSYLYATYYGTVYISPHIVGVGQDITATAVPDNGGTPSWSTPPGKLISGCRNQLSDSTGHMIRAADTTCTWKATSAGVYPPDATAPGGGWTHFGMTFCGFFGCASSEDFYYVLPRKKAISGMVYANTEDAKGNLVVVPVPNAQIRISGPSSGTAVTDSAGFYDALVDPGQYTVHVANVDGQSATASPTSGGCSPGAASGSDCTIDVRGQDGRADFNICPGAGHAGDLATTAAAPRTPSSPSLPTCPLNVTIKTFGQSRSGFAVYQHFSSDEQSKVFFIPPSSKQCVSGCMNVLATVTDPKTGAPVTDATVNVSVSQIAHVTGSGSGFLCNQATPTECGRYLLNEPTDSAGQVHLLYWAPGLIEKASATLNATAKETCSASSCPSKERQGAAKPLTFTVKPYLIYAKTSTLSTKDAEELAAWAGGKSLLARLGGLISGASAIEKTLTVALNALIESEIAAETAEQVLALTERAVPILGVLEVAHAGSELWERQGFISMFLEALDLRPEGLGDDPLETSVSAAPSFSFENQLANYGTVAPGHVGAGGVLWNYAKTLAYLEKHHDPAFGSQSLSLQVYEVSTCNQGQICAPGYRAYASGMAPALYFVFRASHSSFEQSFGPAMITVPYDPNAWTESQQHLAGLLP